VLGQTDYWARFAVIAYHPNLGQFVYSARRYDNSTSAYICQLKTGLLSCVMTIFNVVLFHTRTHRIASLITKHYIAVALQETVDSSVKIQL